MFRLFPALFAAALFLCLSVPVSAQDVVPVRKGGTSQNVVSRPAPDAEALPESAPAAAGTPVTARPKTVDTAGEKAKPAPATAEPAAAPAPVAEDTEKAAAPVVKKTAKKPARKTTAAAADDSPRKSSPKKKPAAKEQAAASSKTAAADTAAMQQALAQLTLGSASAPYVLFEYGDLECPDSRFYNTQILPQLKAEYVDAGRVRYEARAMPLSQHPRAEAAEAACRAAAEQGKYWQMRAAVMANPGTLSDADLLAAAKAAALDTARYQKAVKSGRWAGVIREERAGGQQAGVTGTPTLILARVDANGQMASVFTTTEPKDYRQLKRALDRALRARR